MNDCEALLVSTKETLRDSWQIEHTVRLGLVPLGADISEEVRASDLRIAIVVTDSEFSEVSTTNRREVLEAVGRNENLSCRGALAACAIGAWTLSVGSSSCMIAQT